MGNTSSSISSCAATEDEPRSRIRQQHLAGQAPQQAVDPILAASSGAALPAMQAASRGGIFSRRRHQALMRRPAASWPRRNIRGPDPRPRPTRYLAGYARAASPGISNLGFAERRLGVRSGEYRPPGFPGTPGCWGRTDYDPVSRKLAVDRCPWIEIGSGLFGSSRRRGASLARRWRPPPPGGRRIDNQPEDHAAQGPKRIPPR